MDGPKQSNPEDVLTPAEISRWAKQEYLNSAKAFELRAKEVTELASQYASGEISAEQAKERFLAYGRRWGEALYGVNSAENKTNDQILAEMDEARRGTRGSFSSRATQRDITRG
jgi:hypothetical protein